MNDAERTTILRYRLMILAILAIALPTLSFQGALDDFVRERLVETTQESVGIYAVSRTINAGVSVLQTSQVKVPFLASLQLGEILDPVNDGVERLSTAVVWAIGSLFVQRIVLDVASSTVFQWIFLVSGLIALIGMVPVVSFYSRNLTCRTIGISPLALDALCRGFVRFFVIASVFRFIVPVFVGSSFLASQALLQSELDRNRDQLTLMSEELSISSDTSPSILPVFVSQRDEKRRHIAALEESKAGYEEQLGDVNAEIDALNENRGLRGLVPKMLGGASDDPQIKLLRQQHDHLQSEMEAITQRIVTTRKELECIDRRMEGKRCGSFLERLTGAGKTGIENITKIADAAGNLVVLIANILIALFVKNILIPILFLLIAMKCGGYVVKRAVRFKLDVEDGLTRTPTAIRQMERNAGELQ